MIVFSDIDGTLLNDEHVVLQSTKDAISKLRSQDIPFVIVSARSPSGIYPILEANDFNCHIISYSGGLILDEHRNILYSVGMTVNIAKDVVRFIESEKLDVTWNIYSYDRWIVKDKTDIRVINEENIVNAQAEEGGYESLDCRTAVHKILCMCNPDKILEIERSLKLQFPNLSIVKSSNILLEIMESGVGKGKAVQKLCQILNQDLSETIAFGDNYNDEDMLDIVGQAFIMGNAPDDLKQKYNITFDNNSDGIYYGLIPILNDVSLS